MISSKQPAAICEDIQDPSTSSPGKIGKLDAASSVQESGVQGFVSGHASGSVASVAHVKSLAGLLGRGSAHVQAEKNSSLHSVLGFSQIASLRFTLNFIRPR